MNKYNEVHFYNNSEFDVGEKHELMMSVFKCEDEYDIVEFDIPELKFTIDLDIHDTKKLIAYLQYQVDEAEK